MRGQIESLLAKGIEAAQAGDEKRARETFIHVIELDQRNEKAWLWLSSVVETTADKIVCLENVLFVDPDNTYAAAGLQKLRPQELRPRQGAQETASRSLLPRLSDQPELRRRRGGAPTPVADRTCPRCGFRNPGWAYLCDRCGADLRPTDLREALGRGSRPRGRSFFSLVEAWLAAFVLNRQWAFLPEIELASWGRSLAALLMAVLFSSAWRALTAVVVHLWAAGQANQVILIAVRCATATLLPALLLPLAWVPLALLTWVGARLGGGRQRFKVHVHLTAVAFSAWIVLVALLASLMTFLPYVLGDWRARRLLAWGTPAVVGTLAGLAGAGWLTQAVRTAHRLSLARGLLIVLLVAVAGAALLWGGSLVYGGWFTELPRMLAPFFLPVPPCGG